MRSAGKPYSVARTSAKALDSVIARLACVDGALDELLGAKAQASVAFDDAFMRPGPMELQNHGAIDQRDERQGGEREMETITSGCQSDVSLA